MGFNHHMGDINWESQLDGHHVGESSNADNKHIQTKPWVKQKQVILMYQVANSQLSCQTDFFFASVISIDRSSPKKAYNQPSQLVTGDWWLVSGLLQVKVIALVRCQRDLLRALWCQWFMWLGWSMVANHHTNVVFYWPFRYIFSHVFNIKNHPIDHFFMSHHQSGKGVMVFMGWLSWDG